MRLFSLGLFLLLSLLIYTLFWGKNGILDYMDVSSEIAVQKEVNSGLQERNSEMFAEIDDLRQGLDAIEERARNQLGMVKEGETFYRIIGDKSN
ncbi:cell division protein FtsB [Vibrio sp. JC009]|uniref:cell division protein FtsB n=1 Tax=Vibrio sp. JC009 TaxID=2912314 RepID=UPI0023AEC355|nr:cell division protein FtsB [Vibrio sp. JC009]WED21380.1 cell division protein FtsB [Vibrio sp. JC009]